MDLFAPRIKTTLATLRAQLPARIDAYNTANPTGAQLVHPADDGGALSPPRPALAYIFGGLPRHGAGEYPLVEVAVPDGILDNLAVQQLEGDLETSLVVAVWAGRAGGEDFPTLYEKVLGYVQCVGEVLLVPDAVYPSEEVVRIRFALGANPDRRDRPEMETFTFGSYLFLTTAGIASRP